MIPFVQFPIEAWEESLNKWALCLLHNECNWMICSVCRYVFDISNDPCQTAESGCPLIVSSWCCATPDRSKLHEECDVDVDPEPWAKRVENYLWWIDLEIEAMNGW